MQASTLGMVVKSINSLPLLSKLAILLLPGSAFFFGFFSRTCSKPSHPPFSFSTSTSLSN